MEKVRKSINEIRELDLKNKVRLAIILSSSSLIKFDYDKQEIYEKYNNYLKEIDEEYRHTIVNFSKYKIATFTAIKIMEMTQEEQNKVAMYLFNSI